ncbi:MAG: hypothetical protein PVH00_07780 [Gemmatimonadota bacterium]|jgi:hypothetical protein
MNRRLLVAGLVLVLASCSWKNSGSRTTSRNSNLISSDEIAAVNAATATDIIRQLRPNWLRARGPVSTSRAVPELPVVYVDNVRTGDTSSLDRIPSHNIAEIRFLVGRDATTMYGMDHGGGAILVKTKR